jgi:type IV pilus assembly protein PilE
MSRSTTLRRAGGRATGFTLIELLVAVAIVGILSAIAYPAYGKYMVKSHRAAAQVHMMELAQAEAQYLADSRSYAGSVDDLKMTTPKAVSDKYTITITLADGPPSTFTIKARPVAGGSQAGDGELSLDSAGTRSPAAKW